MMIDPWDFSIFGPIRQEWQSIVDLVVRLAGVRAGLIMRVRDDDIEVFVSSRSTGNPYEVGDEEQLLRSGLYCERVIATQEELLVPNALKSDEWRNNPDVQKNMISYLGFPIRLPDERSFGTICLLDDRENEYGPDVVELMKRMRDLIESHLASLWDITERRRAEEALRASESRYRDLYENAPVAHFSVGPDGRIRRCNGKATQLLGYTSEQLEGWPVIDLYAETPHGKPQALQVFRRFLAGEAVVDQELQMVKADGTLIWISLSVSAILDAAGGVVESRSTVIDITKRKAAERRLAASEQRLQLALEAANAGAWEWDPATNAVIWSDSNYRVLGYEPYAVEASYANWLAVVHPDDRTAAEATVAQAVAAHSSLDVEFRAVWPDGQVRWLRALGRFLEDEAGRPVRIIGLQFDVTAHKALMAELEQHRASLEALVQARTRDLEAEIAERAAAQAALERSEASLKAAERIARIGSWERHLITGELIASDGLYHILGFSHELSPAAAYAAAWDAVHPDDVSAAREAFARTVTTGAPLNIAFRFIRPAGEILVLDVTTEIQCDEAGQPVRMRATAHDVTEQAAARAALERSEASLKAAERIAHVGSWELNLATDELQLSDELCRIFGFELEARPFRLADIDNSIHPDDRTTAKAARERALQSDQQNYGIRYRIVRRDGEVRVVHVRAEIRRDATGQAAYALGTAQDITEQEQARMEIDRRVRELLTLQELGHVISFEHSLDEIIRIYLDRIIDLANLDLAAVFLLRGDELNLAGVSTRLIEPVAQERVLATGESLCGQAVQQGQPMYVGEVDHDPRCLCSYCRASGLHSLAALPLRRGETIIGALALGAAAPDAYADRLSFLETMTDFVAVRLHNVLLHQDIRERAAALEETVAERTRELQTERDRTQAILETMGESVAVTDLDGRVLFVNPATLTLTGHSRDEIQTRHLYWNWSAQAVKDVWPQAQSALRGGGTWQGEISAHRKDGGTYIAAVTGTPLHEELPVRVPTGGVWVQRDITPVKEAERLKDQFVSNVSHELRTPISIIALSCDNLIAFNDRLGEDQRREMVQDIHEQAYVLSDLVEEILILSQIDNGRIAETRNPVDLARLLCEEVGRQQPLAEKRSQQLAATVTGPVEVLGNDMQLRQVVRNLLNNAIKYTPVGGRIGCTCTIRPGALVSLPFDAPATVDTWAAVEVADNGIGMAAEDLPFVFERFHRVNPETDVPGTGLGLAIAQELVVLHGGWIAVVSTPGQGSAFTVYLPLMTQGAGDRGQGSGVRSGMKDREAQ